MYGQLVSQQVCVRVRVRKSYPFVSEKRSDPIIQKIELTFEYIRWLMMLIEIRSINQFYRFWSPIFYGSRYLAYELSWLELSWVEPNEVFVGVS